MGDPFIFQIGALLAVAGLLLSVRSLRREAAIDRQRLDRHREALEGLSQVTANLTRMLYEVCQELDLRRLTGSERAERN
jgi:hypothetical protein